MVQFRPCESYGTVGPVSSVRLSPTSYVILGLLAVRGPATPYELKRAIARSIGYFWSFPHAQIYSEAQRLHEAGLLAERREDEGRRRRRYSLTAGGRRAFQDWLARPVDELWEIRDEAQLKLFFSEKGDSADLAALADHQRGAHAARLAQYRALAETMEGREGYAHRLAPLAMGLAIEEAAVRFWAAVAKNPPGG